VLEIRAKPLGILQLTENLYTWLKTVSLLHITQESFTGYMGCASSLDSQINLGQKTQFTFVPIPKKIRQYILSWIWLWSPLRACAYLLRCEKRLVIGFNLRGSHYSFYVLNTCMRLRYFYIVTELGIKVKRYFEERVRFSNFDHFFKKIVPIQCVFCNKHYQLVAFVEVQL